MKNIVCFIIVLLVLFSCKKEKDYVTFSGQIINRNSDSLIVFHPETKFLKVIKLNENGKFKDTLKVKDGFFSMTDSRGGALLYLINGDDIVINFDGKNLLETISFSGDFIDENDFLKESLLNENEILSDVEFMNSSKVNFERKVTSYVTDFNERLNKKKLDANFLDYQKKEIINFEEYLKKGYLKKNPAKSSLEKGMPSPSFDNYENFKGGTTSLSDFKGKYVYIDVWATWCHPCKEEIPFLKKIEKQFHNKNIEFVSISLDDKRDYKVWKDMIVDEELGGSQLYANGDQKFINAYRVNSIPRFILIDPNGNIVDANAPRPSRNELIQLLNNLEL